MNKSNLIGVLLGVVLLALAALPAQAQMRYSYLPSADVTDAKMFSMIGPGSSSGIGAKEYVFSLVISQTMDALHLGVFDGEQGGHWDSNYGTPPPLIFTFYADPLGDGSELQQVGQWYGDIMPDNDWYDCIIPVAPEARREDGFYGYLLTITTTAPNSTYLRNQFKLRVNGLIQLTPFSIGFMGTLWTIDDIYTIYPALPPGGNWSNGPFTPTTYDGIWNWYLYLPRPVDALEFWDGDFDFGYRPPYDYDTDDPDTPNDQPPPWALSGQETVPEGVNYATPFDDGPNTHPGWLRPPSVYYEVIAPDGAVYLNDNPSGNSEWERFRIDTAPFDRSVMDHHADHLPAGIYTIRIYGLNLTNYNAFHFFQNIVGHDDEGNPVPHVLTPPEHLGSIGDYVWEDLNHDGLQDDGEPPLAGVTLLLINDLGYQVAKARTDENGNYLFKNIPAGTYSVILDKATLPWGYRNTTFNLPYSVSLEKGERHRQADFGYVPLEGGACREVLAWYNPWYGSEESDAPLRHWDYAENGGIADTANFTLHVSTLELADVDTLFDSRDPDHWEHDILLAWAAHIDAFVVNWFGKDAYEQQGLKGLLDTVDRLYQRYAPSGFDFRIIVAYNENARGSYEENFRFLSDSVFTHPAYYHSREGLPRPLFVYTPHHSIAVKEFMDILHQTITEKVVVAWNWEPGYTEPAGLVDSVYPWPLYENANWDDPTGLKWGEAYLDEFYGTAAGLDVSFLTAGVWPGYDGRAYVNGLDHWMHRQNGKVYEKSWEKVGNAFPRWTLIHSFNDFNRTTQVQNSLLYEDLYIRLTQALAGSWKYAGGCGEVTLEPDLTAPEKILHARKRGEPQESIDALLEHFFANSQVRLIAPQPLAAAHVPPNGLVFVKGSPAHSGEGWEKAVDGIRQGWAGTATVKPRGDDYGGDAWAVFRFGDGGTYRFDYVTLQTDNGSDDNGLQDRQARLVDVYVSTSGQTDADFSRVARIKSRSGEQEWYALGESVEAKYIKLVILEPKYTSGGWRQIVEFGVQCRDRQGAKPASEGLTLAALPASFALEQNYPNPFNPVTTIAYQLPQQAPVTLTIYNVQGQKVETLVQSEQPAGRYQVMWNAQNRAGGVYFLKLCAGEFEQVRKMSLMK